MYTIIINRISWITEKNYPMGSVNFKFDGYIDRSLLFPKCDKDTVSRMSLTNDGNYTKFEKGEEWKGLKS